MKATLPFKELVTDESRPLRAFAMKLTQDHEEANDLVQDTLLKVRKPPYSFFTQLYWLQIRRDRSQIEDSSWYRKSTDTQCKKRVDEKIVGLPNALILSF